MDLKNEDSDFFFKGYLDIEQLRANYAAGAAEPRELVEGYVEGYNRYIKAFAGLYPAACNNAKWVRPITVDDMYLIMAEKALHATGQVFAKEFVAAGRTTAATVAARSARKFDIPPSCWRDWTNSIHKASAAMRSPSARTCPRMAVASCLETRIIPGPRPTAFTRPT